MSCPDSGQTRARVNWRLTVASLSRQSGHRVMLAGFWPHSVAQRRYLMRVHEQHPARSTDI